MSTQVSSLSSSSFKPSHFSGIWFGSTTADKPFTISPPEGQKVKLIRLVPDDKSQTIQDIRIYIGERQVTSELGISTNGGANTFCIDPAYSRPSTAGVSSDSTIVFPAITGGVNESISIRTTRTYANTLMEIAYVFGY